MSPMTRRGLLMRTGTGLGWLGMVGLLGEQGLLAAEPSARPTADSPLAPKQPHFPGKHQVLGGIPWAKRGLAGHFDP